MTSTVAAVGTGRCGGVLAVSASSISLRTRRSRVVSLASKKSSSGGGGGFGKGNSTPSSGGDRKKSAKVPSKTAGSDPNAPQKSRAPEGWVTACTVDELRAQAKKGKNKPVVIDTIKRNFMVYLVDDDEIHCSDCNAPPWQFPLIDAPISRDADGRLVVETPLDGTQFDLESGEVLRWCADDSIARKALKALKKDEAPEKLKIYETKVQEDNSIIIKF